MRILKYTSPKFNAELLKLVSPKAVSKPEVVSAVEKIIADVRRKKNKSLFDYTKKFDRFDANSRTVKVTGSEIERAYKNCEKTLLDSLKLAYSRVAEYHKKQLPEDLLYTDKTGFKLGWKWTPVDSVGLYVPGGKAFYPSSVIMNAVPAKVAGVKRIAMVVPAPSGKLNPVVLAAAKVCGIDEIYKIGGAQAVAALAYGTETVKPVVKIVGPGNAYVAEAKRQVFGQVGIDMIAGPSEILVIADKHNNPKWIAADLLSQAEHDVDARSFLITDDEAFAAEVSKQVNILLKTLNRKAIASASIKNNGLIIIVKNIDDSVEIANRIAAEHLEICIKNPKKLADRIHNAGAIFFGQYTPEPIGDYIAGPSHVLPTMTTSKFSSGLGVYDFIKRTSLIECSEKAIKTIGKKTVRLAEEENLGAHALSVKLRLEE